MESKLLPPPSPDHELNLRKPPPSIAWSVGREALGLGILADVLLRVGPWGANVALWLTAACGATLILTRKTGVFERRAEAWPLLLVLAGAAGIAWRDSDLLFVTYGALIMLGGVLTILQASNGAARQAGVLGLLRGTAALGRGAAVGLAPVLPVLWTSGQRQAARRSRLATGAKGILLALPFLLVFGSLFASADPLFERYLGKAFSWSAEDVLSHLFLAAFFAWLTGGILHRIWAAPETSLTHPAKHEPPGGGEVLTALALVDVLFLTFLAIQAQSLFGGEAFVEATLDSSYSAYARKGFFQLVTAAALVLPTLLLGEWAMRRRSARARRTFKRLALLLLASVGVILLSAGARMRLYQDVYGLTELRLFTQAFMAWLAFVLLWFWRTVLSGFGHRFLTGAMASGILTVAALTVVNPDALILRANSVRVEQGGTMAASGDLDGVGFDVYHAAALSADAVPRLLDLLPRLSGADGCVLADRLLVRWVEKPAQGWRRWNWARWSAQRRATASAELLYDAVSHCPEPLQWRSGARPSEGPT